MTKYDALTAHLQAQAAAQVCMSFADIETVVGRKLPPSAASYRAWWSNNPSGNAMTKAWLRAGFKSEQVDLQKRALVFTRLPSEHAPGFAEAPMAERPMDKPVGKLGLFGWLRDTVGTADDVDLASPADPDWGRGLDHG